MNDENSQSATPTSDNQSATPPGETAPVIDSNEVSKVSHPPTPLVKSEWKKIDLEPTLTLAQLNDLYQQLSLYHDCRVQLCGAKVERVDTAALQLLLAFRNNSDITVGWIEPSAELCYSAQLLGLSSDLGLPIQDAFTA